MNYNAEQTTQNLDYHEKIVFNISRDTRDVWNGISPIALAGI